MKNRILKLGVVLALVAVMAAPMAASAATDTTVTGTVAATPVVTSISSNNGNPGQTATLMTITGSGFENTGDTLVTMTGPGLTITASTYVSATSITFQLAIASGATATAGVRDVTVTQGGKSGTGTGIFTVNLVTTVAAPSAIALGYLTAGATKTGSSADGSVTTNGSSWVVAAKDANTGANTGHMLSGATPLAAALQISKTSTTTDLADSNTGITYTQAVDPITLDLYVSQVVAADAAAGVYTITIAFTVSTP